MARLGRVDRLLLWTLLPLFAVCFALHVREARRSGLAQPPIFAVPGDAADAHPRVGGLRLERGRDDQGLRVGDALLSLGDEDLAGVGYLGFEAIALEKAGARSRVPLVYERDGVRREMSLVMMRHSIPWFRIPFLLSLVGVATLILVRSPGRPLSRHLFAGAVGLAIIEAPFVGGPRLQTLAFGVLFNFGGAVALFLLLRAFALFPEEVPPERRASPRWAFVALLHLAMRVCYVLGGPIEPSRIPAAVLAADVAIAATALGLVTWNWAHATPVGRRRVKWALLGLYAGTLPMLLTVVLRIVGASPQLGFHQLFQWSALAAVAVPAGLVMAVVRYNLFDIDRIWSATASLSVLAAALLALLLGVTPALAASLAGATGVDEGTARLALGLALGAALLPAQRRLRGGVERVLFPRRAEQERGADQLLRDLSSCPSDGDVMRLLADRLAAVMPARGSAVYVRQGERFTCVARHGAVGALDFSERGGLVPLLAGEPRPRVVAAARDALADVDPEERARLEAAGIAVLVPIRERAGLSAFVGLGPLRSGDVYTHTDLALLRAVAERAASVLQRLADEDTIRAERVRAERLAALKQAAEEAQAARSRFLAAASHDLCQPLHALGLYAALLEEQLGPARLGSREGETLADLRRTTDSLREMFTSLLDLSRLDVGAVEPELREFALRPLLEQLAAELRPLAEAKGLSLRVDACDAHVRSDPVLLGRILRNLLGNAVRYTQRGEVRLSAEPAGAELAIGVGDTGPGIPLERQAKVFEEFVRGEDEASGEGLGLGLAIVERLARALGHPLRLRSEPEKGTLFRVGVPVVESPARAAGAERAPGGLADARVLLIDDDLAILESTRALLEAWGCRVLAAQSTSDALRAIEWRGAPDALLVDYRLADGERGIDAIAAVERAVGRPLPAAIVSAEATPELRRAARERGLALLSKPLAPARVRAALLRLLADEGAGSG